MLAQGALVIWRERRVVHGCAMRGRLTSDPRPPCSEDLRGPITYLRRKFYASPSRKSWGAREVRRKVGSTRVHGCSAACTFSLWRGARVVLEGRIVATRNYRDFAMLLEVYRARGTHCPSVLLLPVSLSQADVGARLRMIDAWIATHAGAEVDHSLVADNSAWLTAGLGY